jgi:hypothetical protein
VAKVKGARGVLGIWRGVGRVPANLLYRVDRPCGSPSRYGESGRVNYELAALGDVEGRCSGGNGEGDGREKDGEELHGSRECRSGRKWGRMVWGLGNAARAYKGRNERQGELRLST